MSPIVDKRILVSNDIAQLVLTAQHGIPKVYSGSLLGWPKDRYTAVTQRLAGYGYLIDGTDAADAPSPWRDWGAIAWAYHTSLSRPSPLDASQPLNFSQDMPSRPPPFRDLSRTPALLLPRLSPRSDMRFIDVLEVRRTHREFVPVPISIEALSDVLRYTFGPLRFVDAGALGVMQLRAAASGGARHETDAYVYVFNVTDIAPGVYLYDGLRHGLVSVRAGMLRDELDELTFNQGPPCTAGFGVVTVAETERMCWKYRQPGAYRVLWQDVGCLAQVFSLMCASLGLGASMTGAIRTEEARTALRVASASELITFAMCCGHPQLRNNGLPSSVNVPSVPFYP